MPTGASGFTAMPRPSGIPRANSQTGATANAIPGACWRNCSWEEKTGTYGAPPSSMVGRSSDRPCGSAPAGSGIQTWLRASTSITRGVAPGSPIAALSTCSSSFAGQLPPAGAASGLPHPCVSSTGYPIRPCTAPSLAAAAQAYPAGRTADRTVHRPVTPARTGACHDVRVLVRDPAGAPNSIQAARTRAGESGAPAQLVRPAPKEQVLPGISQAPLPHGLGTSGKRTRPCRAPTHGASRHAVPRAARGEALRL